MNLVVVVLSYDCDVLSSFFSYGPTTLAAINDTATIIPGIQLPSLLCLLAYSHPSQLKHVFLGVFVMFIDFW